jgi:hypothetical protein
MAGHSKWANIKHKKAKQDQARGKLFTRLSKDITLAAKQGGGDPDTNFRLRLAVNAAKAANMPNDTIDKAIKRETKALYDNLYPSRIIGGWVESRVEEGGRLIFDHKGYQAVRAVPFDMPVLGYKSPLVNTLRLWSARSTKHLDMNLFGQGRYLDALEEKELAEVLSKVLYPEDNHMEGKALRLKQQYFFVSASIQLFKSRM